MADERTNLQVLADELLGQPVETWLLEQRGATPPHPSWRVIAERLRQATDGKVWAAPETLRLWIAQPEPRPAA